MKYGCAVIFKYSKMQICKYEKFCKCFLNQSLSLWEKFPNPSLSLWERSGEG